MRIRGNVLGFWGMLQDLHLLQKRINHGYVCQGGNFNSGVYVFLDCFNIKRITVDAGFLFEYSFIVVDYE